MLWWPGTAHLLINRDWPAASFCMAALYMYACLLQTCWSTLVIQMIFNLQKNKTKQKTPKKHPHLRNIIQLEKGIGTMPPTLHAKRFVSMESPQSRFTFLRLTATKTTIFLWWRQHIPAFVKLLALWQCCHLFEQLSVLCLQKSKRAGAPGYFVQRALFYIATWRFVKIKKITKSAKIQGS